MRVQLAFRRYGVHSLVSEAEIPGSLADYATRLPAPSFGEYAIDEDKLIAALPPTMLPGGPEAVLLLVGNEYGSDGQTGLSRFRNWAKYFNCYSLTLMPEGCDR